MSSSIPDLWPEEIKSNVLTPVAILRYQASALKSKTHGVLEADVRSKPSQDDVGQDVVQHTFTVIAPAIGRYEVVLFRVEHHPELVYPCTIDHESLGYEAQASDDEEALNMIRQVLGSQVVRSLLLSLIAKSNDAAPQPD